MIAPALALLLWSYLLGNNRIWLPAEVVSVHPTPVITLSGLSDLRAEVLANDDWAFVAYILSQDSSGFTVLTVTGRIIVIPAASLVSQMPCQYEPDYDPG